MLNGFALVTGSVKYNAFCIRVRNEIPYILFRRDRKYQRADDSARVAKGVVRWLRPLLLVAANGVLLWIVVMTLRGS